MGTVAVVEITLVISGARSLKEKRRVLKSLITQLRNKFNISIAEVGYQDTWNFASLELALVGTDSGYVHKVLEGVKRSILNFHDVVLQEYDMHFTG